jgi:ABC-type uncharacterized transport system auxiliary subunit
MTSIPARGAVQAANASTPFFPLPPAPSHQGRGSFGTWALASDPAGLDPAGLDPAGLDPAGLEGEAHQPPGRSRPGWRAAPARLTLNLLLALALVLLASGCGTTPILVHQYLLEYPAPPLKGSPLNAGLKVEHCAVAQAYNTTSMIYQPAPFEREAYKYHRWRVNPGYLVTDYLVRDLRHSGLFKAVFTSESSEKNRFVLEGGVEDFQEVDGPDGWQASLALVVTLLDTSAEEAPQKVVFQKRYGMREPMVARTPQGLAESMSRAMERLSAQIIPEVYDAARKRLAAQKPE